MTPHGRGRAKGTLHMDSSRLCLCLFPYDLAVYPYHISVMSLSPEDNYRLRPTRPSKSLSGVLILGSPNTVTNGNLKYFLITL